MAAKTLVVNFDEQGKFLSATKQEHNVNDVPQPNEPIDLEELRKIVAET